MNTKAPLGKVEENVAKRLEKALGTAPEAETPLDAAALAAAATLEILGADAAFVATMAGAETVRVARVTAYARRPVYFAFPLDAPYPIVETVRTQRALYIADNETLECEHPGLVRVKCEDHACATLPLFAEDGSGFLGALNISFDTPRAFAEADRGRFDRVARACARILAA